MNYSSATPLLCLSISYSLGGVQWCCLRVTWWWIYIWVMMVYRFQIYSIMAYLFCQYIFSKKFKIFTKLRLLPLQSFLLPVFLSHTIYGFFYRIFFWSTQITSRFITFCLSATDLKPRPTPSQACFIYALGVDGDSTLWYAG